MADKPADHRSISSGKDLPNHRTVAAGLSREASLAVKEVCLKYGVPSPPSESNEAAQDWMPNSVLDALAKYISLTRLKSRGHKERVRLLNTLRSGCTSVYEALGKLNDHDERQIQLRCRNKHKRPPATGESVNFDIDVRALTTGEDIDVGRFRLEAFAIGVYAKQLLDEAKPIEYSNPQRLLIEDLVKEWRAARTDRPVAYPLGGTNLYTGEFYNFVQEIMKEAGQKPPHGDTIRNVLKTVK